MDYFICIGTMWDMDQRAYMPARKFSINESQKEILLMFAEKRIDKDCNPIYKIGLCEFTIQPNFEAAMREALNKM